MESNLGLEIVDRDSGVCLPWLWRPSMTDSDKLVAFNATTSLIIFNNDDPARQIDIGEPYLMFGQKPMWIVRCVEGAVRREGPRGCNSGAGNVRLDKGVPQMVRIGERMERPAGLGDGDELECGKIGEDLMYQFGREREDGTALGICSI